MWGQDGCYLDKRGPCQLSHIPWAALISNASVWSEKETISWRRIDADLYKATFKHLARSKNEREDSTKRGRFSENRIVSSIKKGGKRAQVCVDLHQFTHHCESVVRVAKNPWACYVCGENTYTKCGVCNEPLHMIGCKVPEGYKLFSQVPWSFVLRAL